MTPTLKIMQPVLPPSLLSVPVPSGLEGGHVGSQLSKLTIQPTVSHALS